MAEFVDYLNGQPQPNITHFKSDIVAGCRTDNGVKLAGAAAGSNVTVSAVGNDTNVSINITPKGSGGLALTKGDMVLTLGNLYQSAAAGIQTFGANAVDGALARSIRQITKAAIVDATLTDLFTVTVPVGNHSAIIRVWGLATFEGVNANASTRVWEYFVVVTRQGTLTVVPAISAVMGAQIATVSGLATLTSALTLSAVTGTTGVATFTVQVTNTKTGTATTSTVSAMVEVVNQNASGITVA